MKAILIRFEGSLLNQEMQQDTYRKVSPKRIFGEYSNGYIYFISLNKNE